MIFLQIHGLIRNLPLKRGYKITRCVELRSFLDFIDQKRLFGHTHLTQAGYDVDNVSNNVVSNQISQNIINYQRNSDEIPVMETHSLTRAMMQSSKSGFFKKRIWDKYIARSIELRDKFSVKNISIVMISAAKSNLADTKFYDLMSERLITKCQNYLSTYKVDPLRFFSEEYRTEFTAFNIYTILSACSIARYENEKLFKALLKVSEIKLYYFEKYLDSILNGSKESIRLGIDGDFKREDKFTFEDVAGILHVCSGCIFQVPQILMKYSNIFKKMYYISTNKELDKIIQVGEVTPKAFAIAINSLVKLGDRDADLYRMGLEYLDKRLEEIPVRDIAMIFNSILKIRASFSNYDVYNMNENKSQENKDLEMELKDDNNGLRNNNSNNTNNNEEVNRIENIEKKNEYEVEGNKVNQIEEVKKDGDLFLKLTNRVLDKFIGYNFDPESLASISSTFAWVCLTNIFERSEVNSIDESYKVNDINEIKNKFNKLFEEATCMMIVENEPDVSTLVQMLQSSAILNNNSVSKILLSDRKFKTLGLMGSKIDVLQYLTSMVSIYSKTKSKSLREMIEKQFVVAISQYGKRLNYVLYPHTMGLSQIKSRPPDLYNILKLESKGLLDQKASPDEINTDWNYLTKDLSEYSVENISYLGSVLNLMVKFNPCKDYSRFISLSCDYFTKFFKLHSHELTSLPLEIDTISAIVHSLSKYRIKNHQLMQNFSKVIKSKVDSINETKEFNRVNYLALFNIINSYSKLGFPKNRLFDIKSSNRFKHCRRISKDSIHHEMFRSISKLLGLCELEQINLQMVTNCLYSLSLVGFDKFSRRTLIRLINRFIQMYPKYGFEISNIVNRNIKENKEWYKENSFVSEYLKPFDELDESYLVNEDNESDTYKLGNNELRSQVDIITMMMYLMVKNEFFKSRVFRNYLTRIRKVILDGNDSGLDLDSGSRKMKNGRKRMIDTKEIGDVDLNRSNRMNPVMNKMSGFHRSVLTVLKTMYRPIRSEVCWRSGTYYVDVVIRDGRRVKFVEIDGPYHYYSQSTELVSSSKAKHFIMSNYGHRIVHLPYYEWARCKSEEERIKYLKSKIK